MAQQDLDEYKDFTWKIQGDALTAFKNAKKGDDIQSPEFNQHNCIWQIHCHPNGCNDYMGLYLKCVALAPNSEKIGVNYSIHLIEDDKECVTADVFSIGKGSGWDQFAILQENWNSLTFKVNIMPTVTQREDCIDWKIDGWLLDAFKRAKNAQYVKSPDFKYLGCVWRLECYPNGNDESTIGYISIYLKCLQLPDNQKKININYQLTALEVEEGMNSTFLFENRKSMGRSKYAKLDKNLDSLTFKLRMNELHLRETDGYVEWKIDGCLLDGFRSAKFKDVFKSISFSMCGLKGKFKVCPKGWKSEDMSYVRFDFYDVNKAYNVNFIAECVENNYKRQSTKEINKDSSNIPVVDMCKPGIFGDNDSVTIRFKICSVMTIQNSSPMVTFMYNTRDIISKAMTNEFRVNDKTWIINVDSNKLELLSNKYSLQKIYKKIECEDIKICDERIIDHCKNEEEEKKIEDASEEPDDSPFSIPYDNQYLQNRSFITIKCDIFTISEKEESIYQRLISANSRNVTLSQQLITSQSEVEKLNQELCDLKEVTKDYRLKAIELGINDDVKADNEEKKIEVITDDDDNVLYNKHRDIIEKWNETTAQLQTIATENGLDADEKKEEINNEEASDIKSLFDKYVKCNEIMNKQTNRLGQVTTDEYLVELVNRQNAISKTLKEYESKLPSQEEEYNKQNKQYQVIKQQRIDLQKEIAAMIKTCNVMIEKENETFKDLKQVEDEYHTFDKNVQTLKSSLNSCLSVIKLYNDFMENNNQYIDKINTNFDDSWSNVEAKWSKWTAEEMIIWFKYKTMTMNTEEIKWDQIEKELKSRNIKGKSLEKFNELTFEIIGLKDFEILNYLVSQIRILKTTYNHQMCVKKYDKNKIIIPEQFKCPITKHMMQNPVMAFDGHSYEKTAIEGYLKVHNKSPVTGAKAEYLIVFPNHKLKADINRYLKENDIDLEGLNQQQMEEGSEEKEGLKETAEV